MQNCYHISTFLFWQFENIETGHRSKESNLLPPAIIILQLYRYTLISLFEHHMQCNDGFKRYLSRKIKSNHVCSNIAYIQTLVKLEIISQLLIL